jgi:hypothetical protein
MVDLTWMRTGHCWQQIEVGHKTSNIGVLLRSMRLCSASITNHLNIMPAVYIRQHITEASYASESMTLVSQINRFRIAGKDPSSLPGPDCRSGLQCPLAHPSV